MHYINNTEADDLLTTGMEDYNNSIDSVRIFNAKNNSNYSKTTFHHYLRERITLLLIQ